jgi:hypothetical protein
MGGLRKEHKTDEEKHELLKEALGFFQWLVEEGVMGNVTFPLYDGIVGKAKLELFVDPLKAKDIFRMGGGAKNANG